MSAPGGLASTEGARSALLSRGVRQPRSVYRRRQATALVAFLALVVLVIVVFGGGSSDPDDGNARAEGDKASQLPRGGRSIFPEHRVVAFYGAPQDRQLGALGIGSPARAARRLERQADP